MKDENQTIDSNPQAEIPPLPMAAVTVEKKRSKKNVWLIVIVFAIVICVGAGLGLSMLIRNAVDVTPVLDAYMKAMAAKDIDSAYSLTSPDSQEKVPLSDFEELVKGNSYKLFDGYENLSVTGIETSATPDIGVVTIAKGIINYHGGIQGSFIAYLRKVDGNWRLLGMTITIPLNK